VKPEAVVAAILAGAEVAENAVAQEGVDAGIDRRRRRPAATR